MENLNFSQALGFCKDNKKIARKIWVEGEYVVLMPGYPSGIVANEATKKTHNLEEGATIVFKPYFQKRISSRTIIMYSFTTEDILANDWYIVQQPPL